MKLYWLWYGLTLWGTRLVLLCMLYFTNAPTGGPIVDRWYRFFPHTLVVEAGVAMTLAFVGGLLCTLLRGRARKIASIVFVVLGCLYVVAAGTDDEIMRWMGQHLSLSFITTYALAASDMGLVGRVFLGGAWHFVLTTFVALAGIVGTVFLYRKMFAGWSGAVDCVASKNGSAGKDCAGPLKRKSNWIVLGVALALAITGLTSKSWFAPSNMRWKRIAPVAFRLITEIQYKLTESERRSDYAEGIALLGGFPSQITPSWNVRPLQANAKNTVSTILRNSRHETASPTSSCSPSRLSAAGPATYASPRHARNSRTSASSRRADSTSRTRTAWATPPSKASWASLPECGRTRR